MKKVTIIFLFFCVSLMLPMLSLSQSSVEKHSQLEVLQYPTSFAELLKKFKGSVVYIDVMAHWCHPCIVELKESKKLEAYFEENNIVKLYITIDEARDIEKAFRRIQKESLGGYFTSRYSPTGFAMFSVFQKEVEDLFLKDEKGNAIIAVPHYIIVNKNGKIVERKAARPSNPTVLKKQIEKYL